MDYKNRNRPDSEELKKLAKPLIDILYDYYHPHATVIITTTQVKIVEDDIGVPFEPRD